MPATGARRDAGRPPDASRALDAGRPPDASRALDAGRPPDAGRPLKVAALRDALIGPGSLWRDVQVVGQTGSTNADLLAAARNGAPEGTVLVAEVQLAGRGRLGRSWISRPGSALTFSVLLRPVSVPSSAWGWVPLLAGVSLAAALRRTAAVDARLKWPNDVLAGGTELPGGAKLAGILAERAGDAIVVGIGINTCGGRADLPVSSATSLQLEGARCTDRQELLVAVLAELESGYRRWTADASADPGALRQAYLAACVTIGRPVRISLPGGGLLAGTACGIDGAGRLLVESGAELVAVSAGDVTHVR